MNDISLLYLKRKRYKHITSLTFSNNNHNNAQCPLSVNCILLDILYFFHVIICFLDLFRWI